MGGQKLQIIRLKLKLGDGKRKVEKENTNIQKSIVDACEFWKNYRIRD